LTTDQTERSTDPRAKQASEHFHFLRRRVRARASTRTYCPLRSLIERRLVETAQIGELDLQPAKAVLAQGARFGKLEQTTAKVVAEVVQMRRHRVHSPSKVEVEGKIYHIILKLPRDLQHRITSA
jgi:hypothetical protein